MSEREITVRLFAPEDARPLSDMIRRTLQEVNGRDYPPDEIHKLAQCYGPDDLRSLARTGRLYVAVEAGTLAGCGAVTGCEGRPSDAYIMAVFTAADRQGKGVGAAVMEALEADPMVRGAARVELHASLSAHRFYQKRGYTYMGGAPVLRDGCYYMEKI